MSPSNDCKTLRNCIGLWGIVLVVGILLGVLTAYEIPGNIDARAANTIGWATGLIAGGIAGVLVHWHLLRNAEQPTRDVITHPLIPSIQTIQENERAAEQERRDVAYQAYIGFAQQAEANSWNRFNNFLMFNSILIVAWATLFCQSVQPLGAGVTLKAFCIVGIISGVTWAALGYRGRKYGTYFLSEAARFEDSLPEYCQVCTKALETRNRFWFPWAGSFVHLIGWPVVVLALHVVLLALSFQPDCTPTPGGD